MRKLLVSIFCVTGFFGGNAQVNPQNGAATFGIPVFNWSDDKSRLNAVVALSYNSGNGLRVNDVASNIGQGWSLIAGGYISRLQAGEPDDQKPRNTTDLTKYPAGYLYDNLDAADGCPPDMGKYPIYPEMNKMYKPHNSMSADRELDRFAFSINGRSGLFVLGKDNGDIGIALGDEKLKIWYTRDESISNTRTTIDAFFIQDENGLIYKFTQLEKAKIQTVKNSDKNHTVPLRAQKMEGGKVYYETNFDDVTVNPWIVTGWHLTEIEDALTHRVVTITYTVRDINTMGSVSLQYNANKNYSIINRSKSRTQSPDIYKITCVDGHVITFNYSDERYDLKGSYKLRSIDVTYDSRAVTKIELNSNYFLKNRIGIPLNDEQKDYARLALQSVKKYGVDLKSDDPPFEFEYYTGSGAADDFIPPAFSPYKDIFGYFNGSNSKEAGGTSIALSTRLADLNNNQVKGLCYLQNGQTSIDVNPKTGYAKNGVLKKIKYPSGSSLEYQFNQNQVYISGQTKNIGGVHVSKTVMRDGGNNIDCNETVMETSYDYIDASDNSSYWGYENPVNGIYNETYYAPERKRYKLFGCGSFLGCCKYKYQYPGILLREQAIDLTGGQRAMLAMEKVMNAVSLVLQVIDVIKVVMGATGAGAIISVILDAIFGVYQVIKTCFKDFSNSHGATTYYNFDLKSSNPLPAQFGRVVVTEGAGGKGKTVMEFTSPADYAIWENTNPIYSNKQRYANWAYGLPKKTSIYSADDLTNPVRTVENEYDFTNAKRDITELYVDGELETFDTDYPSCKCEVKKNFSKRSDQWITPDENPTNFVKNMSSSAVLKADISTISNGWVELKKTREKNYKAGSSSDFVETITEYTYGKNHQPATIINTLSNGDKRKKLITYTADAVAWGTTNNEHFLMAQHNIINTPFYSRESIIRASDGNTYDLGEIFTEFRQINGVGNIKPGEISERRYAAPRLSTTPNSHLAATGTGVPAFTSTQEFEYFENGNVAQQEDEAGRTIAYIYDYNDKFVVAKVVNQFQVPGKSVVSYSSFETTSAGGWQIGGTPVYTESLHITGNRAFVLNGSNSLTPLLANQSAEYILSFWATSNSTIAINAQSTLVKSGPTIAGLTYYEYLVKRLVPDNATPRFQITGNCTIDELRFYDKMARMLTSTYDPLIGKTSDCDENNRITYYEYDEKGRQRFIKDELGNTIKMFEYNQAYKKVNPACSSQVITYTHPEVQEIFYKECLKSDCEGCPDYRAEPTVYTIPAGTYTSTLSQQAVDDMIQNDLLTNGQAYANANGVCKLVYYSAEQSEPFVKQACEPGYAGSTVWYTVPASRYSSTVNQDAADDLAKAELEANGQAYANENGTCDYTTEQQWEGTGNTRCEPPGNTHFLQYEVEDINPHSPTYGDFDWQTSTEEATECGGTPVNTVDITYTNTGNSTATVILVGTSATYTFNLLPNISTSTIAGILFPGTYTITITQPWGSTANNIQVYSTTQTGGSFSQSGIVIPGGGSPPVIRVY